MKTTAAIAIVTLAALAATDNADARKNERRQARAQAPNQIACTVIGCVEVPRGCGQTPGRTWSGSPTGNDVIVCPPGVNPFPLRPR